MGDNPKRWWRIVHSESSLGWGGQERRILAELDGFRRRRSEVWLLAPVESQLYRHAVERNFKAQPLPIAKWQFPVALVQTARWLRRLRPDILNTHSSRDGWIAGLAGRLAKVPLIIRTRHFDVPIPNRWLSRHVYERLADHVLTTSPRITAHFQKFFQWPPDRISTVPTGIDLQSFSPEGPAARLWPEPAGVPLIGMISVLRLAKGHSILLEAARRLRDNGFLARYILVGDGPMREKLEEQIRRLQLEDCVMMTGHREEVPEILRALDLLVMPSRHEGIPQVGLQALATKTPVIGASVGGIPSIIRHGETGRLIPPEDSAALAEAIRQALQEVEATRAMAERGRALAEAHHGLDGMIETLEALYVRCLPVDGVSPKD